MDFPEEAGIVLEVVLENLGRVICHIARADLSNKLEIPSEIEIKLNTKLDYFVYFLSL